MRGTILLMLFLLVPAGVASAVFYNNTEVIEIGDGMPPEPSPDSTSEIGTSGGESGTSAGGSSSGSSSSSGNSSLSSGDVGSVSSGASSGTGSSSGAQTGAGSGAGSDNVQDENDVINALIASGALFGIEEKGGASGGVAAGVNASGVNGGFNVGVGGSFSIRVVGSKVREALSANIDLKDILTYWRKGKGKASEKELGLIAASTALRDTNVQEVSFTASSFEIAYRSRGYLLAIIPWSFPVRVQVIPEAPVVEERVKVKLPWYRFFIRKFFTIPGLQRDIDEVMTKTKNENIDTDVDGTALLFEAASVFLRQKVGTAADSVLLGIEQN